MLLPVWATFALAATTALAESSRSRQDRRNMHQAHARALELADREMERQEAERATTVTLLPHNFERYVAKGNDGDACYQDGSTRMFPTQAYVDECGNTVETCINACVAAGFTVAAVEYGDECYCGTTAQLSALTSLASDTCNMACSGDDDEACGGFYTMNVYYVPTTTSTTMAAATTTTKAAAATTTVSNLVAAAKTINGYVAAGCVSDGSARALAGYAYTDSALTLEKCTATCAAKGYTYAGTEYSNQCYCANSLTSGLAQTLDSSQCSYACAGNSSEICGGYWAISLYKKSSGTTTSAATTTTTTSKTTSTTTTTASTATASSGWTYQSCYSDSSSRVLSTQLANVASPAACQAECKAAGYTYAGIEYGNQCWCGNSINGGSALAASSCDMKCSDGSTCGGYWTMSLYKYVALAASTTTTSAAASAKTTWTYQNCYVDSGSRVLPNQISSGASSPADCQTKCQAGGYTYAGVEYGNQCWCGNSLSASTSTQCNMQCSDGSTCGGYWTISVWKAAVVSGTTSSSTTSKTTATTATTAATTKTTTTATTKTTTTSTTTSSLTSAPSAWNKVFCAVDSSTRMLNGYNYQSSTMTVYSCLTTCQSKGFYYGGVQNGNECWCGNTVITGAGQGVKTSDSDCSSACSGNNLSGQCGGFWRLSLYSRYSAAQISSMFSSSSTTSKTTTTTSKTTAATTTATAKTTTTSTTSTSTKAATTTSSTSTIKTTTTSTSTTPSSYQPTNAVPASSNTKYVWAHVIVGNTYPYAYSDWMTDIGLAKAAGIDGFFLNIGSDSWQPARVADAYSAAAASGFKMAMSFDMTVLSCGGTENVALIQSYAKYFTHSAAAKVNGKSVVTTFAGDSCTFGQGSTNAGWDYVLGGARSGKYFMPVYNVDPTLLPNYNIDAEVNWGSAWPSNGQDIETSRDLWFMQQLNKASQGYVGTVSPLFFAHLSYKNSIWRSDDFLFAQRWEQMISMRSQFDQVEVVAWNDYGESTYIGPIKGAMPSDVTYYVTSDFPHEDILTLNLFYATAWKTGAYPAITQDKIWVMARPHPASASASSDPYGQPEYASWSQDNMYAQVHLLAPATVTLCAGSSCSSQQGQAGINRFSQPLVSGQGISVKVVRNGQTTASVTPSFTFNCCPQRYNFNYIIKSS